MSAIVVSDTGPVHYLVLIEAIHVLPRLFDRVIIPPAVTSELQHPNTPVAVQSWISALPPWVELRAPATVNSGFKLGPGETEAIALALELKVEAVLMDDHRARTAAIQTGLPVLGTLTILEMGAERGLLDLSTALDALRKTNFHAKPSLYEEALLRHQQRLKLRKQ